MGLVYSGVSGFRVIERWLVVFSLVFWLRGKKLSGILEIFLFLVKIVD